MNEDFVWVRPKPEFGSISITHGRVSCSATRDEPARLTRGEWEAVFKHYPELELCEAPALAPSGAGPASGNREPGTRRYAGEPALGNRKTKEK